MFPRRYSRGNNRNSSKLASFKEHAISCKSRAAIIFIATRTRVRNRERNVPVEFGGFACAVVFATSVGCWNRMSCYPAACTMHMHGASLPRASLRHPSSFSIPRSQSRFARDHSRDPLGFNFALENRGREIVRREHHRHVGAGGRSAWNLAPIFFSSTFSLLYPPWISMNSKDNFATGKPADLPTLRRSQREGGFCCFSHFGTYSLFLSCSPSPICENSARVPVCKYSREFLLMLLLLLFSAPATCKYGQCGFSPECRFER